MISATRCGASRSKQRFAQSTVKPNAGLPTRARIEANSRTVKSAWFSMAILMPHVLRRAAGLAEDGHGPVGQRRHVVPFVPQEQVAAHAAQDGRAELAGDVQMLDDDLGFGAGRVAARRREQLPSLLGHRVPVEDRAHAELDVQAPLFRGPADAGQVVVPEGVERGQFEEHPGQSQFGGELKTPAGSKPLLRVV